MNQREIKRRLKKMVFNELDKVLLIFTKQKQFYSVERLPLTIFNKLVDIVKIKESIDVKEFDNFKEGFSKMLNALKAECKTASTVIGDDCISYKEVESFIKILKDSFEEGQRLKAVS